MREGGTSKVDSELDTGRDRDGGSDATLRLAQVSKQDTEGWGDGRPVA